MKQKTILIVDDDEHCRDTLSIVFENEGYNVITAQTGTEAIKLLETKAINLIFLDVMPPKRRGIEILAEIRNRKENLPVIVMGYNITPEIVTDALRKGAIDFIEKPFSLEKLIVTSQKAINRKLLKGAEAAEVLSSLPERCVDGGQDIIIDKDTYLKSLTKVLRTESVQNGYIDHSGVTGCYILSEEEINGLIYAFERISPTNHPELAFVVACARPKFHHIVDEYIRRTEGKSPALPDHPILALPIWGLPDTQRILVFREQIERFVFQNIQNVDEPALDYMSFEQVQYLLSKGSGHWLTIDRFSSMLMPWLQEELDSIEIRTLYDALCYFAPSAVPYVWCSSMVNRAFAGIHARLRFS